MVVAATDRKLIIKQIYHFLLSCRCQHTDIITDWIDIDAERSVQIKYCAKCWKTFI